MPERAPKSDDGGPLMNRAQSLRAGVINSVIREEGKKKSVEPARFAKEEKPLVKPQKPPAVSTPPSEDAKEATEEKPNRTPPKRVRKRNEYSKTYERPLTKPHRAIVSKSRPRLEGSSIPSHFVDEVLGARIEVTHVNEVKETCKARVADRDLWIPMSAVMWLDKGWQDNMLAPGEEPEASTEPETAKEDQKSFHAMMSESYGRKKEEPEAPRRAPEDPKTATEVEKPVEKTPRAAIELTVIAEPEVFVYEVEEGEKLIEKKKAPKPPPPITTNDMIIDCCCCKSHSIRRARVEFWNAKSPEDLQNALVKMGIRESIQDFAENEALRQGLRSHAYCYRNFSEVFLLVAIICLFVSASQFVSSTGTNTYAIIGGVLCACGLGFYHLATLRQTEYENRTEEVNEYIARYKLNVEPHAILGRLSENLTDLSSLDRKTLMGLAARSQRKTVRFHTEVAYE